MTYEYFKDNCILIRDKVIHSNTLHEKLKNKRNIYWIWVELGCFFCCCFFKSIKYFYQLLKVHWGSKLTYMCVCMHRQVTSWEFGPMSNLIDGPFSTAFIHSSSLTTLFWSQGHRSLSQEHWPWSDHTSHHSAPCTHMHTLIYTCGTI